MDNDRSVALALAAALCFAGAAIVEGAVWLKTHARVNAFLLIALGIAAAVWFAVYFKRKSAL